MEKNEKTIAASIIDPPVLNSDLTPEQESHLIAWVEELKTTSIPQIQKMLGAEQEDGQRGMCCLGVACNISGLGVWEGDAFYLKPQLVPLEDEQQEEFEDLPPGLVSAYFGLSRSRHTADEMDYYAKLNDLAALTFPEIAAEVERLHPEVFANAD